MFVIDNRAPRVTRPPTPRGDPGRAHGHHREVVHLGPSGPELRGLLVLATERWNKHVAALVKLKEEARAIRPPGEDSGSTATASRTATASAGRSSQGEWSLLRSGAKRPRTKPGSRAACPPPRLGSHGAAVHVNIRRVGDINREQLYADRALRNVHHELGMAARALMAAQALAEA